MDLFKKPEISEMKKPEVENYKDIKPESDITAKNAKDFWKNEFEDLRNTDVSSEEMAEAKLEKTLSDYFKDLKEKSDVKDTVPDEPFEASDLKKISPEENAIMREEFSECKKDLIQQWEEKMIVRGLHIKKMCISRTKVAKELKFEKQEADMTHIIYNRLVWVVKMK